MVADAQQIPMLSSVFDASKRLVGEVDRWDAARRVARPVTFDPCGPAVTRATRK